ncbi:hypothetical protein O9G_002391 [Rozella allomycis CSF55]|uniref:Anoctamin transmembrane domain-containing protein n=1 Tax=Rozella allomycis (strain CSF55) TaxID=988480 RepID=A0A075AU11_ROZAC|nr:hypothetical protein O9G_002391 [Rozella allomycis CSF55]|eukprot:EPZ33753.1 hypothetical protein O9G_002391 [Rozella allomycis CSF55]
MASNDANGILAARLLFILFFEHLVILVKLFIQWIIPDIPRYIKIAREREEYSLRAKATLMDANKY